MRRFVVSSLFVLVAVGCQGQGGNPFMRTTVPPPATGAGAPSDPYYNNSGGPHNSAQQPPAIAPAQTVPGPAAAAPVVPPPDKRYSAPGGYNFPQGSIHHRKAVDPVPTEYRVGTSAIARGARPRTVSEAPSQEATIAAVESPTETSPASEPEKTPENTPLEEPLGNTVAKVAFADDERSSLDTDAASATLTIAENDTSISEAPSQVAAVSAAESELPKSNDESTRPAELSLATQPSGGASLRIVAADGEATAEPATPAVTTLSATPSNSPFKAVESTRASLTVAPEVPGSEEAVPVATASLGAAKASPNRSRFYFDRRQPKTHTGAQPAAYVGGSNSAVVFAGGAPATGVTTSPEGAPEYSHHADYSWLRGRLEYSTAARRWKLRYIPIDGTTDAYGGSVVLANSPQLDTFRPGQMVTVEGVIGNRPAEHGSYSPTFELRSIRAQQ